MDARAVSADWARTQQNIGNCILYIWAIAEGGTTRLEESVAAYRAAFKGLRGSEFPLDGRRPNRISALRLQFSANGRMARLEEALAAFQRGPGGMYARAGSAATGRGDAAEFRQCALQGRASGEGDDAVPWRRSRPIVRRWRSGRASGFRSTGLTTDMGLANALKALGERRAGPLGLRRRWRPIARGWKYTRATGFRSMVRRPTNLGSRSISARERRGGTARLWGSGRGLSRGAEGMHARARPLQWADTQDSLGACLQGSASGNRGRRGRRGGRGLPRGAGGADARAGSARLGLLPSRSASQNCSNWRSLQNTPRFWKRRSPPWRRRRCFRRAGDGYRLPIAQRRAGGRQVELAWMKG